MAPVVAFVLVAYGLSIGLGFVVGLTGGHESRFVGFSLIATFIPALSVLMVRLATGEKISSLGWRRFPVTYLPAILLMPAILHGVMLPLTSVLEGGLPWRPWLSPGADGLFHTPSWGNLTSTALIGRLALNGFVGLLVVSVLVFFEEVGWRAWLQPRLCGRLGSTAGVVATALIWAFWHTPFALSGVHHLEGVRPFATALVMPIGQVGAGLIIGWLWLRTECIWMVTLAHAALNNWGQYAFKYMTSFETADAAVVLGAGNFGLLLAGSLLLASGRWNRRQGDTQHA